MREIKQKLSRALLIIIIAIIFLFFSILIAEGENPHANYLDNTANCRECHQIHEAELSGGALLKGVTTQSYTSLGDLVYDTCMLCHGAGGPSQFRPYENPGTTMNAQHTPTITITSTSLLGIPEPEAGVPEVRKVLCVACHNPHGTPQYTVATYTSDITGTTNSLLRRAGPSSSFSLPGAGAQSFNYYSGFWCEDCHYQRTSMGGTDHPAASATNFGVTMTYNQVWSWDGTTYTLISLARSNAGYVMNDRSGISDPIPTCQQCHEDTRDVTFTTPASQNPFIIGTNPKYTYFPHQAENVKFRIELGDDLCLNCHPPSELP
jgi:cytochrome c553